VVRRAATGHVRAAVKKCTRTPWCRPARLTVCISPLFVDLVWSVPCGARRSQFSCDDSRLPLTACGACSRALVRAAARPPACFTHGSCSFGGAPRAGRRPPAVSSLTHRGRISGRTPARGARRPCASACSAEPTAASNSVGALSMVAARGASVLTALRACACHGPHEVYRAPWAASMAGAGRVSSCSVSCKARRSPFSATVFLVTARAGGVHRSSSAGRSPPPFLPAGPPPLRSAPVHRWSGPRVGSRRTGWNHDVPCSFTSSVRSACAASRVDPTAEDTTHAVPHLLISARRSSSSCACA